MTPWSHVGRDGPNHSAQEATHFYYISPTAAAKTLLLHILLLSFSLVLRLVLQFNFCLSMYFLLACLKVNDF